MNVLTQIANHHVAIPVLGMLFPLVALLPVNVNAGQEIPELPKISEEIAAADADLLRQRAELVEERDALRDRVNRHNAVCRRVEEGSPEEEKCTRAYQDIDDAVNSHIRASNAYLKAYHVAKEATASCCRKPAVMPQPNTDASVVDARNVPSGLPKGLESAIDSAYADAPPGVIKQVRGGFLAVMARDWPLAKAYFQGALNLDPANAGLKRLVFIVDQPLPANKQPAVPPRKSTPEKHTLTTLNANADKMSTEEIMKALEKILDENYGK